MLKAGRHPKKERMKRLKSKLAEMEELMEKIHELGGEVEKEIPNLKEEEREEIMQHALGLEDGQHDDSLAVIWEKIGVYF